MVFFSYETVRPLDINLEIYDIFGRNVYHKYEGKKAVGSNMLKWLAKNELPGIYAYRILIGKKMTSGFIIVASD